MTLISWYYPTTPAGIRQADNIRLSWLIGKVGLSYICDRLGTLLVYQNELPELRTCRRRHLFASLYSHPYYYRAAQNAIKVDRLEKIFLPSFLIYSHIFLIIIITNIY